MSLYNITPEAITSHQAGFSSFSGDHTVGSVWECKARFRLYFLVCLPCAFVLSDIHNTTVMLDIEPCLSRTLQANSEWKKIGQNKWLNWLIRDKLHPNGKRQQNTVREKKRGSGSSKLGLRGHICPCWFNMSGWCNNFVLICAGTPHFYYLLQFFTRKSEMVQQNWTTKHAQLIQI